MKTKKEILIHLEKEFLDFSIFLIFLCIFSGVIIYISYSFVDNFLMLENSSYLWLIYFGLIFGTIVFTKLSTVLIYNFISNYEKKTGNKIVFEEAHADNLIPLFFAMIVVPILMLLLAFVIPRNFLYAGFFEHKINNNYIYKELDNDTKKTTILRVENTGDYKNDLGNLACLMINLTSPNNINQENKLEIKDMDCNPYLTNDSYSKVQLRNLIIDMLDKKQTSKEIELKLLGEDKTIKGELVIN